MSLILIFFELLGLTDSVCVTRPAIKQCRCATEYCRWRVNHDIRRINGRLSQSPVSASRHCKEPRAADAGQRDAARESKVTDVCGIGYVLRFTGVYNSLCELPQSCGALPAIWYHTPSLATRPRWML